MKTSWVRWTSGLVFAGLVLMCLPFQPYLVIEDGKQQVAAYALDKNQTLEYTYIHSVSGTQVKEVYGLIDQQLVLETYSYRDQGAGLADTLYAGQSFTVDSGGFSVTGYQVVLDRLALLVHPAYENQVTIGDRQVSLYNLNPESARRIIEVKNFNVFQILYSYWRFKESNNV